MSISRRDIEDALILFGIGIALKHLIQSGELDKRLLEKKAELALIERANVQRDLRRFNIIAAFVGGLFTGLFLGLYFFNPIMEP